MMDNTAFFKARVKMLIKKEKDLAKIKLREGIFWKVYGLNFIFKCQFTRRN